MFSDDFMADGRQRIWNRSVKRPLLVGDDFVLT